MYWIGECCTLLDDVFATFLLVDSARDSVSGPPVCQHSGLMEINEEAAVCHTILLFVCSTQGPHYQTSNVDGQDILAGRAFCSSPHNIPQLASW